MHVRHVRNVAIVLSGLVVASCGMFSKEDSSGGGSSIIDENNRGCIQGVLLDGMTNERLPLKNANKDSGIKVLVRNKMLSGKTHVDGTKEDVDMHLKGEFYVCGIPLDTAFPVFAWMDGYEDFEGTIFIDSSVAQHTTYSEAEDREIEFPTLLADIYMYKKGTETKNLEFMVYHRGAKVEGATVQLASTGKHVFMPEVSPAGEGEASYRVDNQGRRLSPQIRSQRLIKSTNENGRVRFSKDDLVLGGIYQYIVTPPAGGEFAAPVVRGEVQVGMRSADDVTSSVNNQPYSVAVRLGEAQSKLAVDASTLDYSTAAEDGKIVFWFNTEVELDPRRKSLFGARLAGGNGTTQLFSEGTTESMKVEVEGNRVELTPVWKGNKRPDIEKEPGLSVTYSSIYIRAVEGKDSVILSNRLVTDPNATDSSVTINFFD